MAIKSLNWSEVKNHFEISKLTLVDLNFTHLLTEMSVGPQLLFNLFMYLFGNFGLIKILVHRICRIQLLMEFKKVQNYLGYFQQNVPVMNFNVAQILDNVFYQHMFVMGTLIVLTMPMRKTVLVKQT